MRISSATVVAAIAGAPVAHSLSPLIHNAWIEASGLDAVYLAFETRDFGQLVAGLRGGGVRGLNVTAPFKAQALDLADTVTNRARGAGAANLLIFGSDGAVWADNTDGEGLLAAFACQAPGFDPAAGPVVIIGAGGAAAGAARAFADAGAPVVRLVNRSHEKAYALAARLGGDRIEAYELASAEKAMTGANAIVNATPASPMFSLQAAPATTVVMDMVYRPLETPFLTAARASGRRTVDGLAMLIGQARPSFAALFGVEPSALDVRALAVDFLNGVP